MYHMNSIKRSFPCDKMAQVDSAVEEEAGRGGWGSEWFGSERRGAGG